MKIKVSDNALNLCREVVGQLSDGLWEESKRMPSYWLFISTKDGLEIEECSGTREYGRFYKNLLYSKTEAEIKNFFAVKIKQIFKKETSYYPGLKWELGNQTESKFLHCPIDNAVKAYNELRGN